MKTKELQKKSKAELGKELEEKLLALRSMRFGASGTKAKNVKEYASTKKDIAKIKTILNSRIEN